MTNDNQAGLVPCHEPDNMPPAQPIRLLANDGDKID